MLILKIVLILLGSAFTLFGYLIYFRKKYFLINGFEEDFKAGRKNEAYAQKVGLTELIAGLACLLVGVLLAIVA